MSRQNQKGPTAIDLFAGCGGLSLGLEQAGFRTLLFSEVNKSARETYLKNLQHSGLKVNEDIYSLRKPDLAKFLREWGKEGVKEVDLVCGGPPCQGYSGIGHRRTFKVSREEIPSNHLYKEMLRVIKQVEPRVFLFENVRGLLSGRWTPDGEKGEIWRDVLKAFRRLKDYSVRWQLVHAKNYGVPQNRPRVLMVGIRKDVCINAGLNPQTPSHTDATAIEDGFLPPPIQEAAPNLSEVFGDLIDNNYGSGATVEYPKEAQGAFQVEMRRGNGGSGLKKGAKLTEQEYSDHAPNIVAKFEHMIKYDGEIPERFRTKKFAQRVIPAVWGPTGPTITATSLADDYVHFAQPRSLTVREWARLQTFPDSFQFCGPRTTGGQRRAGNPDQGIWDREVPKYTQIGNAVPVRLAREVGMHLAKVLRGRTQET